MNQRLVNWIWHVRGSLPLAPGQTSDDVFHRLDPLFRQPGTTRDRAGSRLHFSKRDQAAQDRMAVFDDGVLCVEDGAVAPVLRYHLTSRALLFCFLAPLMFLLVAQLTLVVGGHHKPTAAEIAAKEKREKEKAELPMSAIDRFLGAPAPEKPKKKDKKAAEEDGKPSATPAYVFAGIFTVLYLFGRVGQARLVKRLFRTHLLGV
ncbi:hypothetical protein ACMGDM_01460 [Sphingomonas sp. DT-51]|uniref:hypothetical protein n=1 Tax=Sphingomonas sp. DT-51 TaxID=3396165 RepID=UPI003F1E1B16